MRGRLFCLYQIFQFTAALLPAGDYRSKPDARQPDHHKCTKLSWPVILMLE
jgi:hypothetical protein